MTPKTEPDRIMDKVAVMLSRTIAVPIVSFVLASTSMAGDWPHWQGPDRNGISQENDWSSKGKEKALWQAELGIGYSTVSIQGGRLFTLGHQEKEVHDTVFALDAKTGKTLWTHEFPAKIWNMAHRGGTLSTPTCDGDRVYVTNREGHFFCFNAADGEVLWERQLPDEYSVKPPTWGFAASPYVTEELVILNAGKLIALEKEAGDLIWESEDLGAAYSTPAPFTLDGSAHLAVFNGGGLFLVRIESGEVTAMMEWKTQYDINAATPVVVDDGDAFFISSGYGRGCAMITRDGNKLEIAWESKAMKNHMAGCLLYEDHLYGFDEAVFKCLDLEGEKVWNERAVGKGAHMIAGDRIIMLSDEGELIIAKASSEGFEALSKSKLFDDGVCWTPPVISDGLIYCRNNLGTLICRDHRPN